MRSGGKLAATAQESGQLQARPQQQARRAPTTPAGKQERGGRQHGARSFVQGRAAFLEETKQGEGAGVEAALPPLPASPTGTSLSSEAKTVPA